MRAIHLAVIAAAFLLLTALPAHAALVGGPERAVAPLQYGAAGGLIQSVATDGTDFLVVWINDGEAVGRDGLYAAAVSENGAARPLPPQPLALSSTLTSAHAAWTGDGYLVAWGDEEGVVRIAGLDKDAALVGQPSVISAEPSTLFGLAAGGRRGLALVRTARGMSGILLDATGSIVRAEIALPLNVSTRDATIAAASGGFVIVWAEEHESPPSAAARFVRVTTEGEAGAPATLVVASAAHLRVSAAGDGDRIGIIVAEYPSGRLRRFTVDAATLSVTTHPVPGETLTDIAAVTATPGGFSATFLSFRGTELLLNVMPFDATSSHSIAVGTGPGFRVRTAATGRATLAVWGYLGTARVILDPPLTRRMSDVAPMVLSAVAQASPAIAPAGDLMLVTWIDAADSGRIMAARLDRSGNRLEAQPIELGTGGFPEFPPTAVFTGRVWLVAWEARPESNPRTFLRRISRDGAVLDAQPIDLGERMLPALASNGDVTVLAMAGYEDLFIMRFSPDGIPLGPELPLESSLGWAAQPALATNGREFLLVYTDGSTWYHAPTPRGLGVFGFRLGADGAPLDAAPIAIADSDANDADPRVASDGVDFLVVYNSWSYGPLQSGAKRVLRNGALGDGTAGDPGQSFGDGTFPQVAPLGQGYVISFIRLDSPLVSVWVVPVDRRGVALEAPRVMVDGNTASSLHALAAADGVAWLAYARRVPEPAYANVQRVFVRSVSEDRRRRSSRH